VTSLKETLESIDHSLKSIANSLEKLIVNENQENTDTGEIIDEISPGNKESQLFMELTGVYMDEERERIKAGKNKKAARRVSVHLGEKIVDFFSTELPTIPGLKIERSKIGGLITFSKDGETFAVLKLLTDLGYSRSERFYEVIREVQLLAEDEFTVDSDNVFFLISSLHNGIEKSYVERLLGEHIYSLHDFLLNKKQVRSFLDLYINNTPTFSSPKANIYFLASDLHPNVLAQDIINDLEYGDSSYYEMISNVNNYEWFSHIEDLIYEINTLIPNKQVPTKEEL
jgi:hypothetical protein